MKNNTKPNLTNTENWQNQINDIENYKTQGTIIRSKEMTIINEERPNKYFYLKEQQKQAKKHIKQLQNEKKNEILTTNTEILKECSQFYKNLYSKQKNCIETQNEILTNLLNLMKNELNEQLTKRLNKNEIKQAIYQMENDKSPGIDGIPVEFYKTFYDTLENDLIQLYNNILFIEKSITNTMQKAIITLIPKKET